MSATYYGQAVIGVRIDPKKLMTIKRIRACDCVSAPTGNFCSNCGKKSFKEEECPIESFSDGENVLDYEVVFGTDREEAVIAFVCAEETDNNKSNNFKQIPENIKEIKEQMRDTLGPIGLWDEKKFGLWSILYCSY